MKLQPRKYYGKIALFAALFVFAIVNSSSQILPPREQATHTKITNENEDLTVDVYTSGLRDRAAINSQTNVEEITSQSTSTALTDGSIFCGPWTRRTEPELIMSPHSDKSFTFYAQFATTQLTDVDCPGTYLQGSAVGIDSSIPYSYTPGVFVPKRLIVAREYYRIVVVNTSGEDMTELRFQTSIGDFESLASKLNAGLALDQDAEVVRSIIAGLNPDGEYQNVATTRFGSLDNTLVDAESGSEATVTATNSLKVAQNNVLVGQAFGSQQLDIDATSGSWIETSTNGGTQTVSDGELVLSTNTTADGSISVESYAVAQFLVANYNTVHFGYQINDTGVANNIRRFGAYDDNDGVFLQLNGADDIEACTRKNTVDTCVDDDDWNGTPVAITGTVKVFEAFWNAGRIEIRINNTIVHTFSAAGSPLFSKYDLPVKMENFNTNGSTTNVEAFFRAAGIYRNGEPTQQPTYTFINSGAKQVKLGAGHLHRLIIKRIGATGGAQEVSVYDNSACDLTGQGRQIDIIPSENNVSDTIHYGINFRNGLCINLSTNQFNVTVIWN